MSKLAQNLSQLLKNQNISATDLARYTGVIQPVIYRLLSGETSNPKLETLLPIANYFSITINQLIGETILPNGAKVIGSKIEKPILTQLPILSWQQATSWPKRKNNNCLGFLSTTQTLSKDAFVLIVKDSAMSPLFPEGTLLIVDTKLEPQNKDFIIAHLPHQSEAIFKQFLLDGNNIILKSLNSDFKTLYVEKGDCKKLGIVIESRMSFTKPANNIFLYPQEP